MKKVSFWALLASVCSSPPISFCVGDEAGFPFSEYGLEMIWALEGEGSAPYFLETLNGLQSQWQQRGIIKRWTGRRRRR